MPYFKDPKEPSEGALRPTKLPMECGGVPIEELSQGLKQALEILENETAFMQRTKRGLLSGDLFDWSISKSGATRPPRAP